MLVREPHVGGVEGAHGTLALGARVVELVEEDRGVTGDHDPTSVSLHDDDLGQRSLSSFSSIGAMDEPKAALREAVELPMRYPELFRGSSLLQPVKVRGAVKSKWRAWERGKLG